MKYLHTMVRVADLNTSLAFYQNALGLKEIRRKEFEKGRFTLVYLAAPGDDDATSPTVLMTSMRHASD
jgi:lactoylglutathione lyase